MINLRNPNKVIRMRPISYPPQDIEKFQIQLKELEKLGVIRESTLILI